MPENKTMRNIVTLLRGFFTTPIISSLGRLGVIDKILKSESVTAEDFKNVQNKKWLKDTFIYLVRLGFMEVENKSKGIFKINSVGKNILRRYSSFYVPHSYFEYMYRYHSLIQNVNAELPPNVERLENVIGSGITHQRYFPPIISYIKRKSNFQTIIDIGCGNGNFLLSLLRKVKDIDVVCIDISNLALEVTCNNLKREYPKQNITKICANAFDIEKWYKHIPESQGRNVISMWFLLHEISNNDSHSIVNFLIKINKLMPDTSIVICELVRLPVDILSKESKESIMPEYLFFHDLSNQGILSWEEYKKIKNGVPYNISFERKFDEIISCDCEKIPSSFIWYLEPK